MSGRNKTGSQDVAFGPQTLNRSEQVTRGCLVGCLGYGTAWLGLFLLSLIFSLSNTLLLTTVALLLVHLAHQSRLALSERQPYVLLGLLPYLLATAAFVAVSSITTSLP